MRWPPPSDSKANSTSPRFNRDPMEPCRPKLEIVAGRQPCAVCQALTGYRWICGHATGPDAIVACSALHAACQHERRYSDQPAAPLKPVKVSIDPAALTPGAKRGAHEEIEPGTEFGVLTYVAYAGKDGKGRCDLFDCRCGRRVRRRLTNVKREPRQSCGTGCGLRRQG